MRITVDLRRLATKQARAPKVIAWGRARAKGGLGDAKSWKRMGVKPPRVGKGLRSTTPHPRPELDLPPRTRFLHMRDLV